MPAAPEGMRRSTGTARAHTLLPPPPPVLPQDQYALQEIGQRLDTYVKGCGWKPENCKRNQAQCPQGANAGVSDEQRCNGMHVHPAVLPLTRPDGGTRRRHLLFVLQPRRRLPLMLRPEQPVGAAVQPCWLVGLHDDAHAHVLLQANQHRRLGRVRAAAQSWLLWWRASVLHSVLLNTPPTIMCRAKCEQKFPSQAIASPPPPPPPAGSCGVGGACQDPGSSCFPAHARAYVAGRGWTPMSQLVMGDRVLAAEAASGRLALRDVYFWGHRDPYVLAPYVTLGVQLLGGGSASNQSVQLQLSPRHFLPACLPGSQCSPRARSDWRQMYARDMAVGSHVLVAPDPASTTAVQLGVVTSMQQRFERGQFNPFVMVRGGPCVPWGLPPRTGNESRSTLPRHAPSGRQHRRGRRACL